MAVAVNSAFARGYAGPLDADAVVADLTARDAIIPGKRFEGMSVYVTAEATNFQLIGGILDANWEEFSGGGGGGPAGITVISTVGTFTIPQPLTKYIQIDGDGATPCIIEGMEAPAVDGPNEIVILNGSGELLTIQNMGGLTASEWFMIQPAGNDLIIGEYCMATFYREEGYPAWMLRSVSDISNVSSTEIAVGVGAGDVNFIARSGALPYSSPPMLKYNDTTGKWQYSNDGVEFLNLGSSDLVTRNVTGHTTQDVTDDILYIDCTSGSRNINLLSAVGIRKPLKVIRTDTTPNRAIIFIPDGAETINGEADLTIYDPLHSFELNSDNVNWWVF